MDPSVNETFAAAFYDFPMNKSSALLLGPYQVNRTYARKSNPLRTHLGRLDIENGSV